MRKNISLVTFTITSVLVLAFAGACTKKDGQPTAAATTPAPTETAAVTAPASAAATDALKTEEIKVGDGAVAEAGKTVTVHYVGRLADGKQFDASADHGQPFTFNLGAGQVIKGWDQGVQGMKVGGKRKLIVPPSLGYGEAGAGNAIPPNATLTFEVELLKVQ